MQLAVATVNRSIEIVWRPAPLRYISCGGGIHVMSSTYVVFP
jgi:hypothetical protein